MVISIILEWYQLLHTLFLTPATQANFSSKKLAIFPTTLLTNEGAFCISQVTENKQKNKRNGTFFEYGDYGTSF